MTATKLPYLHSFSPQALERPRVRPGSRLRTWPDTGVRLHHPHLSHATTAVGGRGFARQPASKLTGSRTPPPHTATGPPTAFHEPPETNVSRTWRPGSFAVNTMQSKLTGVFPMLCIGRMERFQRSDACPARCPAQIRGTGSSKSPCHITVFAGFCIAAIPCLTISANGATRRSAIPHNRISGRYS
jgi:hypothetical protein